ncbi:PKD domain-containing protein [Methanogenium cariaci]|uniref:PKD domain-containing protein n=1 Tax=Methanogenium cariaci TaxID=2197 RepID=UPI0024805066|nr:PKD domain-containing protein [Methanogenium cariaci]
MPRWPPLVSPPTSPAVGQVVSFTGASTSGAITSWNWNFGDGQSGTGQNPSHAYTTAGTKTVSLTVTNAAGTSSPVTKSVTVTTAASSVPVASFSFSPYNPPTPGESGHVYGPVEWQPDRLVLAVW